MVTGAHCTSLPCLRDHWLYISALLSVGKAWVLVTGAGTTPAQPFSHVRFCSLWRQSHFWNHVCVTWSPLSFGTPEGTLAMAVLDGQGSVVWWALGLLPHRSLVAFELLLMPFPCVYCGRIQLSFSLEVVAGFWLLIGLPHSATGSAHRGSYGRCGVPCFSSCPVPTGPSKSQTGLDARVALWLTVTWGQTSAAASQTADTWAFMLLRLFS